jgi:putative ABC transport system permease protein
MIRLLLSDMRTDARSFVGPLYSTVVCSFWVALAAFFWFSVQTPAGIQALASAPEGANNTLIQLAVFLLLMGIVLPSTIVLSSVGATKVAQGRSRFARWRLAGATPAQVFGGVLAQFILLALVASTVGILVALPLIQVGSDFLMSVTDLGILLPAQPTWSAIVATYGFVVGTSLFGAGIPSWRASRVTALEALQDKSGGNEARLRPRSILGAGIVSAGVIFFAVGAVTEKNNGSASSLVMLFGCSVLVVLAILASAVFPVFVRAWTAVVPARISTAWYVARHGALARLTATTSTITPFMIGAGLLSIYFSAATTWAVTSRNDHDAPQLALVQGLVLFTPAAVIAITGSVAIVFMVGQTRDRETALLRATGAPPRTLALMPVLEALIYAVTAFFLSAVVALLAVLLYSLSLVNQGYEWSPRIDLRAGAAVTLVGFLGILIAIGIPSRTANKKTVRDALAADQ